MKTLKLDLDYLAKTYGIDLLTDAIVCTDVKTGARWLEIKGETKSGR